jgi:hypothetical protein
MNKNAENSMIQKDKNIDIPEEKILVLFHHNH